MTTPDRPIVGQDTATSDAGPFPLPPPTPTGRPTRATARARVFAATIAVTAVLGGGAGAAVATLIADGPTPVAAANQAITVSNTATATEVTAAAAKASPSVVTIAATGASGGGTGSGVVFSADGYVITNSHVVTLDGTTDSAKIAVRTNDGNLYDATVVGTDPTTDIAVVRLTGATGLAPATFANSDKIQVGDVAVAIGAPLGLSGTVTDGIISALHRAVTTGSGQASGDSTVIDAIQTDAAINPGNSGGALVSANGEVVGINSAIASVAQTSAAGAQSGNIGIGFAIPANTAVDIAKQLIADGTADHGYLGTGVTGSRSGTGAVLNRLVPGGPAASAGLQDGDVVTDIDSRAVESPIDLVAAIRSHAPGDEVRLTYSRGGKSAQITVTLGTAPAATG